MDDLINLNGIGKCVRTGGLDTSKLKKADLTRVAEKLQDDFSRELHALSREDDDFERTVRLFTYDLQMFIETGSSWLSEGNVVPLRVLGNIKGGKAVWFRKGDELKAGKGTFKAFWGINCGWFGGKARLVTVPSAVMFRRSEVSSLTARNFLNKAFGMRVLAFTDGGAFSFFVEKV